MVQKRSAGSRPFSRSTATRLGLLLTILSAAAAQAVTIEQLTERPLIEDVKISPDGRYLAMRTLQDGAPVLAFFERDTMEVVGGFRLPGRMQVGEYHWATSERVVGKVMEVPSVEEQPYYYGELFAANVDGSRGELLFGYRAGRRQIGTLIQRKEAERAWAEIIDVLPDDPRHILISSTAWSESGANAPRVMRLDTETGAERAVGVTSTRSGSTFYTDRAGEVRVITSLDSDRDVHVQALPQGGEWLDLPEHGGSFHVLAVADDGTSAHALDDGGDDRVGLYRLALDGSSYERLYVHERVDVTDAVLSTDERSVYALRVDDGYPSYLIFSGEHEEAAVFRMLLESFSGRLVSIRSRSRDGRYWIVRTATDTDAGTFYLFDRQEKQLQALYRAQAEVDPGQLAQTQPVSFTSFDGEQVAGYFTPAAATDAPGVAPMVVLVHGGPASRDFWEFDPVVHVLSTRGFSVLRINFRGSTGYGRRFQALGNRHWGDHVQQDIIAGTRWAIEEGMAKRGQVCIMGSSFGAYSAVQSAILAPELYACAVANAGIYDLSLLYRRGDVKDWYAGDAFLLEQIGDVESELRRFSPVHNVDALRAPLLLAHGRQDDRAPYVHARRLKRALDQHDKSYEWFVRNMEAHGFHDNRNQVEYLEAATAFLRRHLK